MEKWIALAMMALAAWTAEAQRAAAPGEGPAVAVVGSLRIPRADFEQRSRSSLAEYRSRSGAEVPENVLPMVRRQLLESMIRLDLLLLEARRLGVTASQAEAEEQLKHEPFFNPGGKFDAARWENVRSAAQPDFQEAVRRTRERLAAQKLNQQVERERTPSDSMLRAVAERDLRLFSLDFLALRGREFDGGYPEPRETEILDAYRAHPQDYRRPDRALLTVVFFDRPGLAPGVGEASAERRSWNAAMKQRADSAIAAIRAGGSFDTLVARYGARRNVDVTRDNYPGFWQGGARDAAALFATPPGEVVPQAVPTRPGYLVIRVERRTLAHQAPLAEVAREIRARLRSEAREQRENRELRPIYDRVADSLATPAIRLRYAMTDTTHFDPGEPAQADLDRYYRGHLADYSTFDEASASIRTKPLSEVREEIRLRWQRERRLERARVVIEGLQRAWSRGQRDPELEREATVREVGPVPVGVPPESGPAGEVLSMAMAQTGEGHAVGAAFSPAGGVVYQILERLPHWKPTFEQAKPSLAQLRDQLRNATDEAGGRELFQRQPALFSTGKVLRYTRLVVPPPDARDVKLTRAEVEHYFRTHLEKYSASEMLEARHILISPTGPGPEADRVARARADSILERIRAGEDFGQIARRTSDDPATRERGGDLGAFGRGVMLDEFERAAFAMRPGELAGPVHSPVGWHIIKCINHVPTYSQPLAWIYGNVGYDAASEKADSLAAWRADSLYHRLHTTAQARAAASRLGLPLTPMSHAIGQPVVADELMPFFNTLDKLQPGEFYPGVTRLKGQGYMVAWVDSVTAALPPTWEDARARAIDMYRRGGSGRAMRAKCAELDSLLGAGWSFDSLGTLWGGLEPADGVAPSTGISSLGGARRVLDSLAFGARGGRPLAIGERSGWQAVPTGYALFRLRGSSAPSPGQLATRMQNDRRAELDRRMRRYFDDLKQRYPVRILDPGLAELSLPPPPPSPLE